MVREGMWDGICLEVPGVGITLDADACCELSAPMGDYAHKKAFSLARPHIGSSSSCANNGGEESERSKKRKRSKLFKAENHRDATPAELVSLLSSALLALTGQGCSLFHDSSQTNVPQREHSHHGPPARDIATGSEEEFDLRRPDPTAGQAKGEDDVRDRPVVNPLPDAGEVRMQGRRFAIPPEAGFFLGQAQHGVDSLVTLRVKTRLLIADPPWPCKSRGIKYEEMPLEKLQSLSVGSIVEEGGIVGVWVTNNDKLVNFVKEALLPAWGCSFCATWYWLKVTDGGEPISPLSSPHKKPFERLVIGRRTHPDSQHDSSAKPPPSDWVIVSKPAQHSRKPYLGHLLARHLEMGQNKSGNPGTAGTAEEAQFVGIELFARELRRAWMSIGDQVLKFNGEEHVCPRADVAQFPNTTKEEKTKGAR